MIYFLLVIYYFIKKKMSWTFVNSDFYVDSDDYFYSKTKPQYVSKKKRKYDDKHYCSICEDNRFSYKVYYYKDDSIYRGEIKDEKKMDMEFVIIKMKTNMMVSGKMINFMEVENIIIKMVVHMKENLKMEK